MNGISQEFGSSHRVEVQLKVTRYDQVASLLVSLLILTGIAVLLMFVVWATQTLEFRPLEYTLAPPEKSARQSDAAGFEHDMELLGFEEIPELIEPRLAVELQAVANAVSTVAAMTDAIEPASLPPTGKDGKEGDDLESIGQDDENDDTIPRWQRWRVRWSSTDLTAYAGQLDFFKIELGAAGGSPLVDYASGVSKARPMRRTGPGRAEKRLYMTWKGGELLKFDKAILARAGIPTANRLMLQFYPREVEDQLARIEMEHATREGHTNVKEFSRTFFGVRPNSGGYEFFVTDQQFRSAPR